MSAALRRWALGANFLSLTGELIRARIEDSTGLKIPENSLAGSFVLEDFLLCYIEACSDSHVL